MRFSVPAAFDGALDVAINAQGVAVERVLDRPILNSLLSTAKEP